MNLDMDVGSRYIEGPMLLLFLVIQSTYAGLLPDPNFGAPINNVTVPLGREAIMACTVHDLAHYKVAWLRVETQTILTIQKAVITKSKRFSIQHSDRTWYLHIKEIRKSDRGWYMCQINTDPMKSQLGFLDTVESPDILDSGTVSEVIVREGSSVNLKCEAIGKPMPQITWRRESGDNIILADGKEVSSVEGGILNITRTSRQHMGPYLCIAANGIPPTVSKRVMLVVHFPPMIWIANQLVGAILGTDLILECKSEAYPKSINYWTKDDGEIIPQNAVGYEPQKVINMYSVIMKLVIKRITDRELGTYKCISKNSLGETEGSVKVYEIVDPFEHKSKSAENNRVIASIGGTVETSAIDKQDLTVENTAMSITSMSTAGVLISSIVVFVNFIHLS